MSRTVFPPDEGHSYFDATPAQIASRISSINLTAGMIVGGDTINDQRLNETIVVDLLDLAAWLARQLAHYHDDLDMEAA